MSKSKYTNQRPTPKQKAFCHKFLELKSASTAYREVYDAAKRKPETVHRNATTLLNNNKVSARFDKLRAKASAYAETTLEEVSGALRTALDQALERDQSGAAMAAAMGLGKRGGLVTDRSRIETVDEGQAHL